MGTTAVQQKAKHFTIVGPQMVRGMRVIHAIDALLYLPESYRLVFAGHPKDQSFYNEIVEIVERLDLSDRVRFMYEVELPNVVISDDMTADGVHTAAGDTPEALASAILDSARHQ